MTVKTTEAKTKEELQSVKDLVGYEIMAVDGSIGKVRDFLFDDQQWVLRYMVAHTGGWLMGRKVLVSPYLLGEPNLRTSDRAIPVKLTRQQIKECPPLDDQAPISRRYELEMARFYSYPAYWAGGLGLWGMGMVPVTEAATREHLESIDEIEECHLRSANEVIGYGIRASDGDIGHLTDLIAESHTWALRYIVVDTGKWLSGKKTLVSPAWIHDVDWHGRKVHATMTRDAIKGSPEFGPGSPIDREYETQLYGYYGLPKYW